MRVKLEHKPGKAEVCMRLSKEEADLVEFVLRDMSNCANYPDDETAKLVKMADEMKKVLATYPVASLV
jgi:hypothetical protein